MLEYSQRLSDALQLDHPGSLIDRWIFGCGVGVADVCAAGE